MTLHTTAVTVKVSSKLSCIFYFAIQSFELHTKFHSSVMCYQSLMTEKPKIFLKFRQKKINWKRKVETEKDMVQIDGLVEFLFTS